MRALELAGVALAAYLAGLLTAALAHWLRRRSWHRRSWTCVLPPGHDGPCVLRED